MKIEDKKLIIEEISSEKSQKRLGIWGFCPVCHELTPEMDPCCGIDVQGILDVEEMAE